jgi:hypothetical protein
MAIEIDDNDPLLASGNTGVLAVLDADLSDVESVYRTGLVTGLYVFEISDVKVVPRDITIDKKTGDTDERPEFQCTIEVAEVVKLQSKDLDPESLVKKRFVERRVQLPGESAKEWLGAVAAYLRDMTGQSIRGKLSDEMTNVVGSRFQAAIKEVKAKDGNFYPRLEYKNSKSFKPL